MNVSLLPLDRETTGLKVFPLFTVLGWMLIGLSVLISVLLLSSTGAAYWGGNAKATRDAAEVGSLLLSQLSSLALWSKLLPPLVFLGIGSFMVGIAMEFSSIPEIIDRRTDLLKQALPLMGRH
jgi:hypothetical protein